MEKMNKILAIIPARSGSKSVPHKNIRLINGKPMLAYSIEHAKKSKYINRIILSTDSENYAEIGKEYGAEVPFLRPDEYATDTALDIDVFYHCLDFLKKEEGYIPDIVVQLRPTYPIRNVDDIDAMIELLLENPEADSVRSIAPAKEIAYKMHCAYFGNLPCEKRQNIAQGKKHRCKNHFKYSITIFHKKLLQTNKKMPSPLLR